VIVHAVAEGSFHHLVRFRHTLRGDPGLAAEYEALKRDKLAELGAWYSGRDKEPFIGRVLEASP
jgi:GrpB-like predicted nucleotidyltransferase (UPF0157 family)